MARNRFKSTVLNQKGQTSIEFLFLFLIMLFYLQAIIQPTVEEASESIKAVNKVGQAKLAAVKLANTINEVSAASGDSSKTIWLFLEEGTGIECDSGSNLILYNAEAGLSLPACGDTTECEGQVPVFSDVSLNCENFQLQEGSSTPKAKVRVAKVRDETHVISLLG